MAIVSDIQFQDAAVKPAALDTTCSFLAASFTASTSMAVGGDSVSPTGLFTAKSGNNVEAYFETTNTNGTASIFLNNDARPMWELAVSGNTSDSFIISNCTGVGGTTHYNALSITPAGAIGLGKKSAASVLDIAYADSSTGGIILTETTNSITTKIVNEGLSGSVGTTSSHKLGFRTAGVTRGVFDTSGRLGVGTDAPGALLDVRGAAVFNEDGADVDFRIEGDTDANLFFVNAGDDEIGIGTQTADGLVHIHAGTAGSAAAGAGACNLVVENSAAGGITILTPNANAGSLVFGSPADALGAEIKHTQSSTTMEVGTKESGGILKLNTADGTNAVYIDASQNVGIGTATPGVPLRVQGNACFTGTITANCVTGGGASLWSSATNIIYTTGNCVGIGTATPDNTFHVYSGTPGTSPAAVSTDHDDIVVEVGASGGLSIQVPDNAIAAIALGSCSSSSPAQLAWDYDGNTNGLLTLGTNQASAAVRIMSTNCSETVRFVNSCVGIGTTAPAAQVELKKDQNATTTLLVSNATSGTAGAATLQLGANANAVKLQALSSAYTTSNAAIADGVLLESASTASGGLHLSAASTNELALWTNDTRRVTITSAGCVGIGTATTSDEELKVQGDACVTGTMYAQSFSGGGVTDNVWIMSGQDAYFKELTAGDNIGIGTTTPAHTLHVGGNAASAPALLVCDSGGQRIEVTGGAVKINNAYTLPAADGTAGQVICTDGSDTLAFGPGGYWTCISGPELYYNGGNVGIGTTDPGARLDVQGGGVIFNDAGGDYDVRMEGDAEANLFMLDASVDRIGIGTATPSHTLDVEGDIHASGNICATGDLTVAGDDIIMGTNTDGYILVADGTNYNPVAVSGDVTISNAGAVTIAATSVENSMLAGSIANAKLANDSVSYGGVSLDLGGTDATPAFCLNDAQTDEPTGANDIAPKCYVDTQITANAKGVCCVQTLTMCFGSASCTTFITAGITTVNCNSSWAFGESQTQFANADGIFSVVIACDGQCVYACRAVSSAATQCVRVNVIATNA
jgi:hypothetical protein